MLTTIIILAIVLFFGKFIYDSYLTNNTNERWEEHVKSKTVKKPEINTSNYKSEEIQNSIKTQGYYLHNYDGLDKNNNPFKFQQLLIFLNNKYVCYVEPEENQTNNKENMRTFVSKMKEMVETIKSDEYNYLDDSLGKYKVVDNKIEIIFFNPKDKDNEDFNNPRVFKTLHGDIRQNELILNHKERIYDYSIVAYRTYEVDLLKNSKFKFIPL